MLHFYQDLVEAGGFELETAGSLKGGRKLWALAKTGQDLMLKGGDLVKSHLLLATGRDGTSVPRRNSPRCGWCATTPHR